MPLVLIRGFWPFAVSRRGCIIPGVGGGGLGVCGGSQGVWDWLWFSCGVAHGGGSLVPVFHGFSVSVGRNFILAGGLGAGLAFCGVWAHS